MRNSFSVKISREDSSWLCERFELIAVLNYDFIKALLFCYFANCIVYLTFFGPILPMVFLVQSNEIKPTYITPTCHPLIKI